MDVERKEASRDFQVEEEKANEEIENAREEIVEEPKQDEYQAPAFSFMSLPPSIEQVDSNSQPEPQQEASSQPETPPEQEQAPEKDEDYQPPAFGFLTRQLPEVNELVDSIKNAESQAES